jgi:hypothetical protein
MKWVTGFDISWGKYSNPVTNFITFIRHMHECKILFTTYLSLFFLKFIFYFINQYDAGIFGFVIVWCCQFHCDVVCNVTVWRSFNFLLHLKDTKSSWTNLGDKTMSFIAIVNSFKGWDAVFFKVSDP